MTEKEQQEYAARAWGAWTPEVRALILLARDCALTTTSEALILGLALKFIDVLKVEAKSGNAVAAYVAFLMAATMAVEEVITHLPLSIEYADVCKAYRDSGVQPPTLNEWMNRSVPRPPAE